MFGLLLIFIVVLVLCPFERFLCKRIAMFFKIKKLCEKKQYSLHIINHGFLFSGFNRKQSDFYIETTEAVYSIKLVGTIFKKNYLKFVDDTHYAIRPLAFQIAPTALGVGYNVKEKPQYSFFDSIPDSGLSKNLVKVVLVCPVSGTLQYNDLNVGCGESIGEALCYTTSSFLKELNSQA